MKRITIQPLLKSILHGQSQKEFHHNKLCKNLPSHINETQQEKQMLEFQILQKTYKNYKVEDVTETKDMIQINLIDIFFSLKDSTIIYPTKINQNDSSNILNSNQLSNFIYSLEINHKQQNNQLRYIKPVFLILRVSEQQKYFHKFIEKLHDRKVISFFVPFHQIDENQKYEINKKTKTTKKIMISKKFLSFLGHGINQTCVNLKKYGLLIFELFSQNLIQKIVSHYKKTLSQYKKLFSNKQISKEKLKQFCSCILEQEIKIKRGGSKSLYHIQKVQFEIFVPGPGIVIIEVIQKQTLQSSKNVQKFQFQWMEKIYEQRFNEAFSLNHLIKIPHSKMLPKDVKICSYKQISSQK